MCVSEGCCLRHMHLTIQPVSSTTRTHKGVFISRRGAIPRHLETQWSVHGCGWMQKIKTYWKRYRRTEWKNASGTLKSICEQSVSRRQSAPVRDKRDRKWIQAESSKFSRLEILQQEGRIMTKIMFSSLDIISWWVGFCVKEWFFFTSLSFNIFYLIVAEICLH